MKTTKRIRLLSCLTLLSAEDEKEPNLLTLFNATENRTKWHKDRIIEGWTDLLADPKTKSLAEDLVAYAFYTSGFRKSLHSFFAYIPPAYLKEIGYVNYIKNTRENWKDNAVEATEGQAIYEDVLKNLWHNSEVTPHLPESDLKHKRPFKEKEAYPKMVQISSNPVNTSGTTMLLGENLNGDPIFRPTFKTVISGETYKYRYIGFRKSPKTHENIGVYAIDSKRGYNGAAGKIIKEYGLASSIFDDNNIKTVSDDEVREMENTNYYKETAEGKMIYDYSEFHYVPSVLATVAKEYTDGDPEGDTESATPVAETTTVETPEVQKEKSPLTDVKTEAIKDNEQDYLHCKIG